MEIETMKARFIELLRVASDTQGGEIITISDSVLRENGLSTSMFWQIICPQLQKEGVLKSYEDKSSEEDMSQMLAAAAGSTKAHEEWLRSRTHDFIVDKEKLFESAKIEPKHIIVSDTPTDTSWREMRFQFTGRHSLHASVPSKSWARDRMTPKDFGLERKNGRAMTQWVMLQVLSENDGKIPLANLTRKEKDTKQRQLTDLSRIFQEVFPSVKGGRAIRPMDGDRYECAFELIPEQRDEDE